MLLGLHLNAYNGIRKFVSAERRRWVSEEGVFCVHDKKRYS